MNENSTEQNIEKKEDELDIRALLLKYLIHWQWFAVSVVACIALAWLYLHFTAPVYNISASVLIKDEKKGGSKATMAGELEKMGLGGMMSSSQNIDNEIEVLRSKSLAKEVVNSLGLYINYMDQSSMPAKELYKTSPVQLNFTPQEAEMLKKPAKVDILLNKNGKLEVSIEVGENVYEKKFDKLPAVFPTNDGTFAFTATPDSILTAYGAKVEKGVERHIVATVVRPMNAAKGYLASLSIQPTSKTTSVADITLKNTNKRRGMEFINKLLEMYNRNTNNDKNEIAQKTADFIDERIGIISKELGNTEMDLEAFKRSAGITDLTSDAKEVLQANSEYEKKSVENSTQISIVRDLERYLNIPGNEYEVLPGNVGLSDAALAEQINRYNELLVERKRLIRTSTEDNPAILNLNTSITAMKANVKGAIAGTLQGLLITKSHLDREASKFNRRISDAPGQERQLVSISRQQQIKAELYLMLLQKREENAIMLAATANNAKIIDDAIADDMPVSPKKQMIYLVALVLGLGLPVAAIYLLELLRFKIENREDLEKITKVPVIGDVPLTIEKDSKEGSIVVFANENNQMSEVFRHIRTNVQFMLQGGKKVILVTSTVSGEGKSFISSNIAISLSLLGKRVVIVGLDIRKPGLNKVFRISHKEKGITNYLVNPKSDLMDLVQQSDLSENLYILPGGVIPPNPTELLAMDALDQAIDTLKKNFDYVVLDTAPIGMVTDTQLVGRVADLSIYVCRAGYTHKAEFALINELVETNKLPNLCTVINGVDMTSKRNYYGYGRYGKHYGYGQRYGYSYGHETKKKKK